jgi:alpha-mannosidase
VNGDNGPPDELMPDVIKEWNEKYDSPQFYIGTTKELFTGFEKEYEKDIPVYSGDMTPTWEDGAASTARELAMNRESSERLNQTEILWSMLKPKQFPGNEFLEAWKNVVLFSEHTWGASASGPEPESEFTKKLWAGKKLYADNADSQSKKLYTDVITGIESGNGNYVHVLNTNLWKRSDVVTIDKTVDLQGKALMSPSGELVSLQKLHDGSWIFVAKDITALSSSVYKIVDDTRKNTGVKSMIQDNVLDNGIVHVEIDKVKGTISSLTKAGEKYNYASERGLNDYVYTGRFASDPQWVENIKRITVLDDGEVAATLRIESDAPGCHSLLRDVTVYKEIGRIDIINTVDKENIYKPENVRFVFPFNIDHGEISMDLAMSEMHPEREQLTGVNKNYYSIQNCLSASNLSHGIYLTTIDAPFVELGEMTSDVWKQEQAGLGWWSSALISPKIYSWVMNNSWRTNYKASQDGMAVFRYSLELFDPFDPQLKKQGVEQAQKMIAVTSDKSTGLGSLFRLKGKNQIAVSTIKPSDDGKGYILRLLNMNDQSVHSSFIWGSIQAERVFVCDHNQEQTREFDDSSFWLKPYECVTLKLITKK